MRRGTTPTFTFHIKSLSLENYDIYISFEQNGEKKFTRKDADVVPTEKGCDVSVTLSQEETLSFEVGKAKAQVRAVNEDGVAVATLKFTFKVESIILEGTIPQEV